MMCYKCIFLILHRTQRVTRGWRCPPLSLWHPTQALLSHPGQLRCVPALLPESRALSAPKHQTPHVTQYMVITETISVVIFGENQRKFVDYTPTVVHVGTQYLNHKRVLTIYMTLSVPPPVGRGIGCLSSSPPPPSLCLILRIPAVVNMFTLPSPP